MKFTVDPTVEVPASTMPGLYPIYYITADAGTLCPTCVNDNRGLCNDPADPQWCVTHAEINYEITDLRCDHCSERIESAYGETE